MTTLAQRLFVALQHLLPKRLMTRLVYRISRVRQRRVKDFLIGRFVSFYGVDLDELERPTPDGFDSLNDFFTRELAPHARPVDGDPMTIVSPVDGTVSACGKIHRDSLFQAKGRQYSLTDLLVSDVADADDFVDGSFVTIYLAPYNYHRVHAPLAGELVSLRHVPGTLYSVNAATAAAIPRLFCRNERLVCRFDTAIGRVALILVGALNVGSITTPWTGELRPRGRGVVREHELPPVDQRKLEKGQLVGWFNMGSTVIALLPPGAVSWQDELRPGATCRLGAPVGTLSGAA